MGSRRRKVRVRQQVRRSQARLGLEGKRFPLRLLLAAAPVPAPASPPSRMQPPPQPRLASSDGSRFGKIDRSCWNVLKRGDLETKFSGVLAILLAYQEAMG
jgi:hypothetical protein